MRFLLWLFGWFGVWMLVGHQGIGYHLWVFALGSCVGLVLLRVSVIVTTLFVG